MKRYETMTLKEIQDAFEAPWTAREGKCGNCIIYANEAVRPGYVPRCDSPGWCGDAIREYLEEEVEVSTESTCKVETKTSVEYVNTDETATIANTKPLPLKGPTCIICGSPADHAGPLCKECRDALISLVNKETNNQYVHRPEFEDFRENTISQIMNLYSH